MTPQQLVRAVGASLADATTAAPHLTEAMAAFEIQGQARVPRFLGQIAHESARFSRLVERLSYSAERLREMGKANGPRSRWAAAAAQADTLARNPEALANFVYGARLGNVHAGDGWRYRGRGYKMLTGAANYAEAGAALRDWIGVDLVANPDAAAEPRVAAWIAAWFWHSRGLNAQADAGHDETITRRINGGLIGHADRLALSARAREVVA